MLTPDEPLNPTVECAKQIDVSLEGYTPAQRLDALILHVTRACLEMAIHTGCTAQEVLEVVTRETNTCIWHRQTGGVVH